MLNLRELAGEIGETAILPTIGHELRTPLTSICGYLETVLDGELDPSTSRRFLQTAQREANRLAALIDALVPRSAVAERPARPGRIACDVVEQIRRVVENVAPISRRRLVTLRTTLPARALALVDADECIHALTNLVENAIKHGRPGGAVSIGCRRRGDAIVVIIDDDGVGIARSDRSASDAGAGWSALFETGVRGETQTDGCGIGLAIVRAVAMRAGGDVAVARSPLGGARFILRLPAG